MLTCLYVASRPGCPNERTLDYEFCLDHLDTPRGKAHVMEVISRGMVTLPSQVQAAIEAAREIPDEDYQTQALEKMSELLDRVLSWETKAKEDLDSIPPMDRRYTDRSGAEQMRSEVGIYERALDRSTKALATVSKMAINEKMVSLGKAQTELMIKIMMNVIARLDVDNKILDMARGYLLDEFRKEANLAGRVEHHVTKQLEVAKPEQITIHGYGVFDAQTS